VKNGGTGVVFLSMPLPVDRPAGLTLLRSTWTEVAWQEKAVLMKSGGVWPPVLTKATPRTPVGINLAAGTAMVIAAAFVAALIPTTHVGWRFTVVALAVGVFAALTLDQLALAGVAVLGWLVVNGFLVDRLGELSWHGSADLYRMLLLVVAGTFGLAVGEVYRQLVALRARWMAEALEQAEVTDVDEEETHGA
jgi:MFS family permease